MKNNKIVFLIIMMSSTIMSISSLTWFTSWIGLEMNLLTFMPLMSSYKNKILAETSIKYFIIQAMASSFYLFSIMMLSNMKPTEIPKFIEYYFSLMINSSLMLKLGAAPFHFWFPEIMSGLSWEIAFILLTWQKIAPSILLTYSMCMPNFLMIFIVSSSMISGIQGLNQTCLRKIIAYSSINHISWMITSLINSMNIWLMYLSIYTIINLNIILMFMKYNIFFMNQINKMFSFNKNIKFIFILNFFSLSGLPPFLGFYPKWMTINMMVMNNYYLMTLMMIILTLISMYMYMRTSFSSFSLNNNESINKIFKYTNYSYMYMNTISLMSLIILMILPML